MLDSNEDMTRYARLILAPGATLDDSSIREGGLGGDNEQTSQLKGVKRVATSNELSSFRSLGSGLAELTG